MLLAWPETAQGWPLTHCQAPETGNARYPLCICLVRFSAEDCGRKVLSVILAYEYELNIQTPLSGEKGLVYDT